MTQPQAYNRETDFTERDGDDTNHTGINAELDAAALSINQIRDNLELIQGDDGGLKNGIVTAESLSDSAFAAIRGDIGQVLTDTSTAADRSVLAAAQSEAARDNTANIYDQFDDRYLGSKANDPSTDNDGQPLIVGALYFNTTVPEMRVWIGTAWKQTVQSPDTLSERSFLATAGQTSYIFVGGYRVGYTFAWVNGAILSDAYITATDGVNVTFTSPLSLNDEVRILSFKSIGTVAIADIIGLQAALDAKLSTSDGAVGTSSLANGAATGTKLGADVVKTTGNQTVAGTKTFSGNVQMQGAANRFVQINDNSVAVTDLGIGVLTGYGDSVGLNNPTATGAVSIGTNNAIRVHVTNDGKVGIGTTTPGQLLTVAGGAHIADTFIGNGTIELSDLGSGDRSCYIDFHSSGAPSSLDYNARIIRNAGANNALAIANNGTGPIDFLINGTAYMFISGGGRINMPNNSGARSSSGFPITTPNDSVANATRQAGYIEWASDIGAIGTNYFTSDIRKKENIAPSTYNSLGLVEQIEFVEFDWKPDAGEEGHVQVGVIAQQLQQLDPRLVAELSDGSLMIKEPALVTHLAKAIQEQQAIIKQLQADLAELKSNT